MSNYTVRPSIDITLSVWTALFLREAVTRVSGVRAAWLWLLLEPVFHTVYIIFIHTVIRIRVVGGMEAALWIMIGLLVFFTFQHTALQGMHAISANGALFVFRQIKPVDTVIVRAFLEGFLIIFIAAICFSGMGYLGFDIVPDNPLAVLVAFFGVWLVGLGFALISSVFAELVPEAGHVIRMVLMPLYFISGVLFPVSNVVQPYRSWVMLNPLVHGLEAARLGFAPRYTVAPELSVAYLYGCGLVAIFIGLALHQRFGKRLAAQ